MADLAKTSLRESCGWCGACGSLEFVADEPKGATAFAHLQWIAVLDCTRAPPSRHIA